MWPWVRRSTLDAALDLASMNAAMARSLRDECSRLAARVRQLHAATDQVTFIDRAEQSPLASGPAA